MFKWGKFTSAMKRPEIFFSVAATFFGLLFVVLVPPLQGPDEQAHFAQVYRYSTGYSILHNSTDVPESLAKTYKTIFYGDDIRFKGNEKYELGRTKHALLEIPLNQNEYTDGAPYGATGYPPINYAVQTLLVLIGRLFNSPIIVLIYLARIGSLITFVALLYAAIRLTPVAKHAFVVIGLLPMTLFLGSMVNSDAVMMGSIALFIAVILSCLVSKGSITSRQVWTLVGVTFLLASTKLINVVLLPLLLLLVFKKTSAVSHKKIVVIALSLIVFGTAVVLFVQQTTPLLAATLPDGVVPKTQMLLMLSDPQKFLFALWNTYMYAWGDPVWYSMIGTFGWSDTPMAVPFVLIGYVLLIVALLFNRGEDHKVIAGGLNKISRAGVLLIALGYFVAVNAAMFIFYTPVDFNIVVGVQGRYMIPILFLLAIVAINQNVFMVKKSVYDIVVKVLPCLLIAASLMYIFLRYYTDTRI